MSRVLTSLSVGKRVPDMKREKVAVTNRLLQVGPPGPSLTHLDKGVQVQDLPASNPLLLRTSLSISPPASNHEDLPVWSRLGCFTSAWSFSFWSSSIVRNGLGWSCPPLCRFYQYPTQYLEDYVAELLSKNVAKSVKSTLFQGRLFVFPRKTQQR